MTTGIRAGEPLEEQPPAGEQLVSTQLRAWLAVLHAEQLGEPWPDVLSLIRRR